MGESLWGSDPGTNPNSGAAPIRYWPFPLLAILRALLSSKLEIAGQILSLDQQDAWRVYLDPLEG